MKMKAAIFTMLLLALGLFLALAAAAKPARGKASSSSAATARPTAQNDDARLEGERRFHANCGRCHTAPPKFPPRMMATIVRHMRVRATITEKDMRLILHYMTQ